MNRTLALCLCSVLLYVIWFLSLYFAFPGSFGLIFILLGMILALLVSSLINLFSFWGGTIILIGTIIQAFIDLMVYRGGYVSFSRQTFSLVGQPFSYFASIIICIGLIWALIEGVIKLKKKLNRGLAKI